MGQNFLKSEPALRMMLEAGSVTGTDVILEIGPGKGVLTERLLANAKKVIAIEKDRDLIEILKEKFKEEIAQKRLELILGDCLLFDPNDHNIKSGTYKLIANIPYNITGAIIKKFLAEVVQPNTMVLLVQKEVAERIVARDNKESILSLSVKAYGDPKYMMKVGKRFFSPSPKVDSAIVAITNITKDRFRSKKEEEYFFTIVKAGFAHKRKVLRKNLEEIAPKSRIDIMFEALTLGVTTRAEDIPITLWFKIQSYLSTHI